MPSNFDFLQADFNQIFAHAVQAENLIYTAPRASCFYTRYTLEQAVIWLYDNDPYLNLPYDTNLGALIYEQTFKDNLSPHLFPKILIILKTGNIAVHDSVKISEKDSLHLVKELFHFLYWLCGCYSPNGRNLPNLKFDSNLLTKPEETGKEELTLVQLQNLESKLSQAEEMKRIAEQRQQKTEAELARLKAEIDKLKQANTAVKDDHDWKEAQTRQYLIDVLLKEMGWDLTQPNTIEYKVRNMPKSVNPTGKGAIDYVLWDDNGLPLAVIEAKRTRIDANAGKQQAKLYADCLQQEFKQRPLIFYSNGYQTYFWDDLNYPPRLIEGFLRKDELQRIIFRRTQRKSLNLVQPDRDIAGRSYQTEAIKRVTETLSPPLEGEGLSSEFTSDACKPRGLGGINNPSKRGNNARKALLVMATGTGKTRTAIALIDLLIRANWIKRVLFLADRTSLLTQAKRAMVANLPNATVVDITKEKDIEGANIILSTYPTIMNRINNIIPPSQTGVRGDSQNRLFGVGYFDLIIVDEAHRSIYKKYQAIFSYFDALLIGLTATPRNEINRDTYRIFDLEAGNPTFAYELNDAIADGYLVPPTGLDVPFKFLRRGVKYNELSPEEQQEYEEKFFDEETGEIPEEINSAALNRWLFNQNTVDRALKILMEWGLKIDGGDRLGKTIIFARNHKHAEFIVERFDSNYPHYKGAFARIIDSHDRYAQTILDEFSNLAKEPTIAVSVDMLDTGVDVPEVLNLVFFKPVYSEVKFNQMIGRGTRLCSDLFGVGRDKAEFLILDLCDNFAYFEQEIPEKESKQAETLNTRLLKAKLELQESLTEFNRQKRSQNPNTLYQSKTKDYSLKEPQQNPYSVNKEDSLSKQLLDELHQHVASMEENNFLVRKHLQQVETFNDRNKWNNLTSKDKGIIINTLIPLPDSLPRENPRIKNFDLLCFKVQLAILKNTSDYEKLRDKIRDLLTRLEDKKTIPAVKEKLTLIEAVQQEDWWQDITPYMLEEARKNLRELMVFIEKQEEAIIYTDFQDRLGELEEVNVPTHQTGFSPYQYRKKVEAYIQANQNHVAIAKLKRNIPLTESDLTALEQMLFTSQEIETKDKFEAVYGEDISLKSFIRQLVGLDRNSAKEAFATYLQDTNLTANQTRFIEQIIDWLTQHGVMNPYLLYEAPFTDIHMEGVDGVFNDDDADNIIAIVRSFNDSVEVTFDSA